MRIALDAMGGDHGPRPNVVGALAAVASSADLTVVLVGDRAQVEPLLVAAGSYPTDRVEVFHCSETVGMNEKPVEALRKKPDNSITRCWQLLATQKVDGLVSAGNTGAVVGAGVFSRRFLKGIRKPGIAAVMPTSNGKCVLLDVGANIYPKPSHLIHYGVMGSVYARRMLGIEKPRIGLINVGEEEGKGHDLVQETFDLFRKGPLADRFVGNIEGRDVHKGNVDVIVTDGFVGNVLLKYAQGLVAFVLGAVAKEVIAPLAAEKATASDLMKKLTTQFHYSSIGGAPLLGVDGACIICHGSSDERAIANALGVAAQQSRVRLNEKIVEELATLPVMSDEE
jgi:glycerol-3-phosphate acyltransferase PlsX